MRTVVDEELLLAVLNSAPVEEGRRRDELEGPEGDRLVERFGGVGTPAERAQLRRTREALQAMVRGDRSAAATLAELLGTAALAPTLTPEGVHWDLTAPADRRLAARTILAWSRVVRELPGRLRACANTECNLFLVDHSRPGTARWCSMATCGNRMKARAFSRRARQAHGRGEESSGGGAQRENADAAREPTVPAEQG